MNIVKVLQAKFPGAEWVLTGEEYDGLEWLDDSDKPTLQELEDAWDDVALEEEKFNVKFLRRNAYREISDPIFFQWQAGEATEQEWLDSRAAIVEQFPYSN